MFEWDERARSENLAHFGVDFVRAARMFDNPVLEREDTRQFAGERRRIALGHFEGSFLVVVTTMRGPARRILQAWRADEDDQAIYRARVPQAARTDARPLGRSLALPAEHGAGVLEFRKAALSLPQPKARKAASGS